MARKAKGKDRDNADVLDEIKTRHNYGHDEWKDIREQGGIDMRYVSGDCWDPEERKERDALKRPILEVDELNQYLNQAVNNLRQNKRGIKVEQAGSGATDDTARWRQGKIRDIEYRSKAQTAYLTMVENVFQRGYGFLRIKTDWLDDTILSGQELLIEPIVNPDCVTPDPDHLRQTGADLDWLFYEETWKVKDFVAKFPDAKIKDFSAEVVRRGGKRWFKTADTLQVAEYWTKEQAGKRIRLLLKPTSRNQVPLDVWADELSKAPHPDSILKRREVIQTRVVQYLTNGVEILQRNEWSGKSIPWVCCYGKVLYLDDGSGAKKHLLSAVRLARSPQMLYAYYRTQQAEMAGMIPKAPVMGYKGQFDGVENDWAKANHIPVAFLEANITVEGAPPGEVLPLPVRLAYEAGAHLQALELCAEGARRAIQAAMGISPLPTQAQRRNEKSGIALKQIEDSEIQGSFHFVDHYDESIERCGEILDENLQFVHDTAQDSTIRTPTDKTETVRINDPKWKDPKTGQPRHIDTSLGRHNVTISVGPAQASERENAKDLVNTLLGSKEVMAVAGPQRAGKIVAQSIRLIGDGPIADEMADIFDPKNPDQDPAQLAQKSQELEQHLQQTQQQLQQAVEEIKTDRYKVDAQVTMKREELAFKKWQAERDSETKIAVAELGAKVDRLALFLEERARLGMADQASEDRAHEVGMAAMSHEHATAQAQQGAQQQAAAAEQQHGQALEAGDVGHQQALEQQQQAAELAPQQEAGA